MPEEDNVYDFARRHRVPEYEAFFKLRERSGLRFTGFILAAAVGFFGYTIISDKYKDWKQQRKNQNDLLNAIKKEQKETKTEEEDERDRMSQAYDEDARIRRDLERSSRQLARAIREKEGREKEESDSWDMKRAFERAFKEQRGKNGR